MKLLIKRKQTKKKKQLYTATGVAKLLVLIIFPTFPEKEMTKK